MYDDVGCNFQYVVFNIFFHSSLHFAFHKMLLHLWVLVGGQKYICENVAFNIILYTFSCVHLIFANNTMRSISSRLSCKIGLVPMGVSRAYVFVYSERLRRTKYNEFLLFLAAYMNMSGEDQDK